MRRELGADFFAQIFCLQHLTRLTVRRICSMMYSYEFILLGGWMRVARVLPICFARRSTVSFVLGAAAQLMLSFALSAFGVLLSVGHFWTMGARQFWRDRRFVFGAFFLEGELPRGLNWGRSSETDALCFIFVCRRSLVWFD